MTVSLASLLVRQTKAEIYAFALGIAQAIGLPVSSWQPGDPTRSLFHVEGELLATLEEVVAGYVESGFLDHAKGAWLKFLALQVFNVVVPEPTYASTDVVLTNNGGGLFADLEPGDLTFKSTVTGKTYTNTTGGTLASGPGTTLTVTVVADEPGSDSSAGVGEIDDMVTTLDGVTCTNPEGAVGIDEQAEEVTRQQCRNKLSSLSPNGTAGAYSYVALNAELTGTSGITGAREYGSATGTVTVYLRGPAGAVSEVDRAKVETAILRYATPLCITPVVQSVSNVSVPVTYTLWVYKSVNRTAAEVQAEVLAALQQLLARQDIGGDIITPSNDALPGYLYRSLIESTILRTFPQAFRVAVSAPSGDVAVGRGQVAALGTVTPTIVFVVDP